MSALLWPGDDRAGDVFSDAAVLAAMVRVEQVWLEVLAARHPALHGARLDLDGLLRPDDLDGIARHAAEGANPVIPLRDLLRTRLTDRGDPETARWLHRGLTSQDVLDTALVLEARRAAAAVTASLLTTADRLAALGDRHRETPMTGRTLTQPAVPIRFGSKVAVWLDGVLDATADLDRLEFPAQVGGAAGTLSGVRLVAGPDDDAVRLATDLAARLDLAPRRPWHTNRAPVTRIGDALTRSTAACGRIANDVLTLSRPEIGELREGAGGGSSTMPQKANPVLSTMIRRTALAAPALQSSLLLAAADTTDERPAGAWHLEWQPLALLARHTVSAAAQTADLVDDLQVDTDRMAANLTAAHGLDGEAAQLTELVGSVPAWAGADHDLVEATVARARTRLEGTS